MARTITYQNEHLKLVTVADQISSIDNNNDLTSMFHEDIEIKLFYEGSSTLIIGNRTIVTSPGDIVVINPYEFHSTVDIGERKGVYHLLMVSLDFFQSENNSIFDLRHLFIKEHIKLKTLIQNNSRLYDIIINIVNEVKEKKPFYESVVHGLIAELFALLLRDFKSDEPLNLPLDNNIRYYELIYPAIQKIRNDYAQKITVDELASLCNISKYHFCRIFKKVTSLSAVNYQTEYRLQVADILLKNTDKSITEIAVLCDFEDACYFSRCYKKHTGVSPKQNRAILSK